MSTAASGLILIVDDVPTNLEVICKALHHAGFDVAIATSGEQALQQIERILPDLILLDIMMPGINGFEVFERLKANPAAFDIPVIFVTAISDSENTLRALESGAVDYVTKPFQVREVLARVRTHVQLYRLTQNLEREVLQKATELQTSQQCLIQSEKMAALGQLIAGVSHEINNPLGAMQASAGNTHQALKAALTGLPELHQRLDQTALAVFFDLIGRAMYNQPLIATIENRVLKRKMVANLQQQGVQDALGMADLLMEMGIVENIEFLQPLLDCEQGIWAIQLAYNLTGAFMSNQMVLQAVERCTKIVSALKNYARFDISEKLQLTQVTEGLETTLKIYANQLKYNIQLIRNYQDVPPIWAYPDELIQVWTNLIHNAVQSMAAGGTLTIATRQKGQGVEVSITDTGPGIPLELQPKIFDAFFTTKSGGEGNGLGLNICQKIIDKHRGNICVESQAGRTQFSVWLPKDGADCRCQNP